MPKAVHRSGCYNKHNWPRPLTPQSIMPSLNHCDLRRRHGRELNSQAASCKSNALATQLPSHLATINMGQKFGGSTPFWEGGAGSPANTKSPGPRPTSIPRGILIHAAIWPQQIFAKNWGLCAFGGGAAGSPSNTMCPGPRSTCMPSFILIHSTVWPQWTNITDRQDSPIA